MHVVVNDELEEDGYRIGLCLVDVWLLLTRTTWHLPDMDEHSRGSALHTPPASASCVLTTS